MISELGPMVRGHGIQGFEVLKGVVGLWNVIAACKVSATNSITKEEVFVQRVE